MAYFHWSAKDFASLVFPRGSEIPGDFERLDGDGLQRVMRFPDLASVETMWTATSSSSQKARNLRHDPRVALHWPERPDRLIFMRATARLIDDDVERQALWDRDVLPYDQQQFFTSADDPELLFVELRPVVASIHDGDPSTRPRRFRPER